MPIKIYWGPPGSYKTSSAVADEVARCAREGRLLITNIRGISAQRIRENVPACAPGFDVVHLRMDDPEQLHKLRTWWHWAPQGAYFVLDEVQAIYPPDWTATKLRTLDMQEPRVINGNTLPATVDLAFDMHRHGNWDFCFTTPSIKKVIGPIRGAAECAYKHKNLAIVGVRGRFIQFMHLAEDNGNASDMYGSRWRRIPKWVFECYDSTVTGQVTDSRAGWSIFANPKLLLLFGVILGVVALVVYKGRPPFMRSEESRRSESSKVAQAPGASGSGVVVTVQGIRGASDVLSAPSQAWRIVQVVENGARRWFYVASGRSIRPLPAENCNRGAMGWFCRVEDGIATTWSGPDPIVEMPDRPNALSVDVPA